jgi:hypothetical protein
VAEFLLGNELEGNGHLNGTGQQFFNAFFAKQFAKLDQKSGVARQAVLKVFLTRKPEFDTK